MKTIRQYIDKAGDKAEEFRVARKRVKDALQSIDEAAKRNQFHGVSKEILDEWDMARAEHKKALRSAADAIANIYIVLGLDVPEMKRPDQLDNALKYVALSFNQHKLLMNDFCKLMNK